MENSVNTIRNLMRVYRKRLPREGQDALCEHGRALLEAHIRVERGFTYGSMPSCDSDATQRPIFVSLITER